MKLFFPKLYRYERLQEHCAVGMPFPQGAFRESMRLKVLDDGKELPVQSRVTSRYADGSIRYLFVRTMVDLPAGRGKTLDASVVEDSAPVYAGLTVTEQDHSIEVHGARTDWISPCATEVSILWSRWMMAGWFMTPDTLQVHS